VVPQLRRIEEAGASSGKAVELGGIEESPRTLTATIGELADEPASIAELTPGERRNDEIRAA
jgi:hypothetical protein